MRWWWALLYTAVQSWPFHCCWTQLRAGIWWSQENVCFKSNQIISNRIDVPELLIPLSGLKNWLHHFSLPRLSVISILLLKTQACYCNNSALFSQLIKLNLQWNKRSTRPKRAGKKIETQFSSIFVEMFIAVVFVVEFNNFNKSFDSIAFFGVETINKWCDVLDALLLHSVEIIHY